MGKRASEGPNLTLEPGGVPARLSLPLRVHVQGVDAVLISATAYEALTRAAHGADTVRKRSKRGRERSGPGGKRVFRLTRLDKEPEVRSFILERIDTDDITRVREAAIERFGSGRVPSKSRVYAFVAQHRARGIPG